MTTDSETPIEITPTFAIIVAASGVRDDVGVFINRHGVHKLVDAYQATLQYLNGDLSRRMTADEIDGVSKYEAIAITDEIEEIILEMHEVDPIFEDQIDADSEI